MDLSLRKLGTRCAGDLVVFLFIDKLRAINNGGEFEKSCKEIYDLPS